MWGLLSESSCLSNPNKSMYSMIKLRQTPPRISETTVWNGMKIKPQVEETFARLIAKFGHQRLHGFGGMHG